MRRILVTGASTWTGGRLIQRLERRARVEVHAVDHIPPRLPFTSPFHHLELDRLEFAHFVLDVRPEIVVHLQTVDRSAELGRSRAHEEAVVGAQALAGAIARAAPIKRVIVKSDASIYGSSPRNPSVFSEDSRPHGRRSRYPRDLSEMERFFETIGSQYDHVTTTVLRFTSIFGPNVANPISRFLRMRMVPTLAGFDPRLQFVYEDDAVRALEHAVLTPVAGIFNVAAPGQLYLSRVLRLGKRIPQPLPKRGFEAALRMLKRFELSVPPHIEGLLKHGMVINTERMQQELGFVPRLGARQAVLAAYGQIDVARSIRPGGPT
jgi:UDP-glucose 4-epimerase